MKCKNKQVVVDGLVFVDVEKGKIKRQKLNCIITNDELGKTLSINNNVIQFTIAFESIAKIFKISLLLFFHIE